MGSISNMYQVFDGKIDIRLTKKSDVHFEVDLFTKGTAIFWLLYLYIQITPTKWHS